MNALIKNPYRFFFSLGTLGLLLGLAVWVVFGFYSNEYYLGRMHAHYMIGIFLLSFVIGFLMTVIPKMTASPGAGIKEFVFQLLPMIAAAVFGVFESTEAYFFMSLALALFVLFRFCASRIIASNHMIPDVFPMVIVSLLSGLGGTVFLIFGHQEIGGRLFYLNMILGLCVGVGAKLIPMILRLGCASSYGTREMWLIGFALTGSSFVEVYGSEKLGGFIRFVILVLVFFRYWKGHRPGLNSSVALGVRIAAFSIVLGTLGLWCFSDYRLESLHLLYISGFGLLTLMVASRMILSYGNFNLSLEFNNWFLRIPIFLIILASIIRTSAVFGPDYEKQLAVGALTFLVGGLIWAFYFLPKITFKS